MIKTTAAEMSSALAKGEITSVALTKQHLDRISDVDNEVKAFLHVDTAGLIVALVTLVNLGLGLFPTFDGTPVTLQRMMGWLLAPLAWLAGIPWNEARTGGNLLATKTVLNELVAYVDLARLPADALSERSRLLMTYALCGFANFGSLGIMIGGLATMCPARRAEVVELGMKSIVAGTLATCMTAAVVGLLV